MARAKKFAEIRNKETGEVIVEMMGPRAEDDPLSLCLRVLTHQLQLKNPDARHSGGLFGGTFGYGVDFENDIFEMHYDRQDYDCTCGASEPKHVDTCDKVTKLSAHISARMYFASDHKTEAERDREIENDVARGMPRNMAILGACSSQLHFERFEEYDRLYPFPSCSCGVLETWKESIEHARDCQDSIARRPCFTHKPSGFAVDWYKYIGRDNKVRTEGNATNLAEIFESCLASIGSPEIKDAFDLYVKAEDDASDDLRRSMAFWTGGNE